MQATFWKYSFWLGPVFLSAGITAGVFSGTWVPVPVGLTIAGAIACAIWLLFYGMDRRAAEANTNALLVTLAVVVILGVVNFLGVRYSTQIDLTEGDRFTLAPLSRQVVEQLQQPAKIWIFTEQRNPADVELLELYQRFAGDRFSFEFVNPIQNPGLAQEFEVQQVGDVFLEVNEERQFVQNTQMEPISEAKLTTAIERSTSGFAGKVYFTEGHGERSPNAVTQEESIARVVRSLEEKNIEVMPLSLAGRAEVPADASAIVVAGPRNPFFEEEVTALQAYLSQGGGVLLLLDPQTDPGLNPLLEAWGITIDQRFAVDPAQWVRGLGPVAPVVIDYGAHPITEAFSQQYTFYPLSRPLEVTPQEGIEALPLLFTSAESWAESTLAEGPDWVLNPESDRPGPLLLGSALTRPAEEAPAPAPAPTPEATPEDPKLPEESPAPATPEVTPEPEAIAPETPVEETDETTAETETPPKESRLVVIGDSDFILDGFSQTYLNEDLFLNTVTWLTQQEDGTLSIRPKDIPDRRLNLEPTRARLVVWLSTIVLPLIAFTSAIALWLSRR